MDEEEGGIPLRKRIPKRFLVVAMITYMSFNLYGTKHVITYAIRPFLVKPVSVEGIESGCNATSNATDHRHKHASLYGWNTSLLGALSSSYSWSYGVTAVIGGVLSDKFGARRIILIIYLISTVWVGLCPFLIRFCGGYWQLIVAWNVVNGLIHGPTLPAVDSILGQWIPFGSRTIACSFRNAALMYGLTTNVVMCELIVEESDQIDYPFYTWCCLGILMSFFWYCWCFSSPEEHPTITEEERMMLRKKLGPYIGYNKKQIPWKKMLTSLPVWAFLINHVGLIWGFWSVLFLMPAYARNIVKIDTLHKNLIHFHVLPTILMTSFDLGVAVLCDYLIRNRFVDITAARKIYANFGCMGSGIFAVSMTYAGCHQGLVTALHDFTLIFLELFLTGVAANSLDLAPNFAGILRGLATTFGVIATYPGSYYLGRILYSNDLTVWRITLWISFGAYTSSNIIYALACSGEEREWNIPQHLRKPSRRI